MEHHRRLRVSESADQPGQLFALRKQLSDRLDAVCRSKLTMHVDTLIRAVSLRQADECAARCRELETFCAFYGARAAAQARRQLVSACAGQLSGREEALQAFLRSQNADFHTLCLLTIKLLAPEQDRVSDHMESHALAHIGDRITVGSIAAVLGYNATYLGRKFSQERGIGFREWLTEQRVQRGAMLLRTTDGTVGAIAKSVGYYKLFLRHFKKRYGVAPEQYRRQKP
jgi:AraC-like DNA-binding protein